MTSKEADWGYRPLLPNSPASRSPLSPTTPIVSLRSTLAEGFKCEGGRREEGACVRQGKQSFEAYSETLTRSEHSVHSPLRISPASRCYNKVFDSAHSEVGRGQGIKNTHRRISKQKPGALPLAFIRVAARQPHEFLSIASKRDRHGSTRK